MSDNLPEVRVGDADREAAIVKLRSHCADGRLTLDEFSDRVTLAYEARTTADLERLMADLPTPVEPPLRPAQSLAKRAVRRSIAIFSSHAERRRFRVEGETMAVAVFGSVLLDLREAEVVGPTLDVTCHAVFGSIEIYVPEGVEVEMSGFSIFGSRAGRLRDVPIIPGAPVIRVKAFPVFGSVLVRSKGDPADERARKKERREQRHRERHQRRIEHTRGKIDQARETMEALGIEPKHWLPTPPPPPLFTPPAPGIEAVADAVEHEWPSLRPKVPPEGTVTILFSDIEGFTSINERVGDFKAQELLREHYRLVRQCLDDHGGYEVKVYGDGFMVAFASASRALRCAICIQEALAVWNRASGSSEHLRVRMGLHTGEAIRDADDFLGSTVNLASRIAGAARGEEILVSSLLRELCAHTGEFEFDSGRDMQLKGLSKPHRVFSVAWR